MSSDTDFLHAQVRSLENENRALRQTLRDNFAMAVVAGFIRSANTLGMAPDIALKSVSALSYKMADAMMEARKQ